MGNFYKLFGILLSWTMNRIMIRLWYISIYMHIDPCGQRNAHSLLYNTIITAYTVSQSCLVRFTILLAEVKNVTSHMHVKIYLYYITHSEFYINSEHLTVK